MVAKIEIVERQSSQKLTDAINDALNKGWKIAGNSYTVVSPSPGKTLYSILLMLMPEETDE